MNEFNKAVSGFENETEDDMIAAFKVFDKNGDGKISKEELKHVMCNVGEKLSDEEAEEMIKEVDVNADGYIDYNEFVKMLLGK